MDGIKGSTWDVGRLSLIDMGDLPLLCNQNLLLLRKWLVSVLRVAL